MQLWNKLNKEELEHQLRDIGHEYVTISFYTYAKIANPSLFRDHLFVMWSKLDVVGRTYVAHEGINSQIAVPTKVLPEFREQLYSIDFLNGIRLNYAVDEADLLIAVGVRFDDRVTGKVAEFAQHGFIVHIDIDPSEINKNKLVHIPIVADVNEALSQLNEIVEPPEEGLDDWHAKIERWKEEDPFAFDETYPGILAQEAIAELSRLTAERNTVVAVGVGQHQMWAAQFYKFRRPRTWLSSSGLGTMGFGLPAAMGAKVGCPDDIVIDIDGDGSILMNIQEFATCTCENIPVKVLLLNNQHLGMVVQWEDRFFKGNRAHTYLGPVGNPEASGQGDGISPDSRYPDFVAIAQGFGWQAETISEKKDLESALTRLLDSDGPALLDVQVPYQEHVLPMIPSGMSVRELIKK